MSKELTTKSNSELKVYTEAGVGGAVSSISGSDVQVPCLMLMQANSTFVAESDDINSGDFLHSISREVWGKKNTEPVEMVIFDMFKTQISSDVSGKAKKWIETLPWDESMELDPYEELLPSGVTVRREKCFNYCVFRALDLREVKKPDGSKGHIASPIVVKFKGGSLKHGKRLNQMLMDYNDFGAPCWSTTFTLRANLEEKDGSKYWAYDFVKGEQTLKEQQLAAALLFKKMQKASIQVVDSDEQAEVKPIKNHAPGAVC